MGDARFEDPLVRLKRSDDRKTAIDRMTYDDLILALGAASRERDPYLANVLTSELLNRSRRWTAHIFSAGLGVAAGIVLLFLSAGLMTAHPHNFDDHVFMLLTFVALVVGAIASALFHSPILRRVMRRRV
ncbi:MAG TPA: hypothetical protein VM370_10135 [Candidatus Thermoplasmatota archaeon]|nr:hypothetical protein [Candidatus Thermoplasmatota archaeon]